MKLKLLSLFILFHQFQLNACSLYKITMGGKTFVGDNVDHWNANTRIWFEKGKAGEYGFMLLGYDNLYPQRGLNEKGLVFGGLNVAPRQLKKTKGLLKFDGKQVMQQIMKTCETVEQVSNLLKKYDRTPIADGVLYFVDKSGDYLIVEIDTMIKGNQSHYLISNFCPSLTPNLDSVKIPFYQKGRKMMESKTDTGFAYLRSLSDTLHQSWQKNLGGTLYTVIYDLEAGSFNLFFYHDYNYSLKFNLKEELARGDTILSIPTLFPANKKGQEHLVHYNKTRSFMSLLNETGIAEDSLKMMNYIKNEGIEPYFEFFERELLLSGYRLLHEKKTSAAIRIFKFNEKYSPHSWYSYNSLGNAYLQAKNYPAALAYFKTSLVYNPGNKNAIRAIKKINKYLDH